MKFGVVFPQTEIGCDVIAIREPHFVHTSIHTTCVWTLRLRMRTLRSYVA